MTKSEQEEKIEEHLKGLDEGVVAVIHLAGVMELTKASVVNVAVSARHMHTTLKSELEDVHDLSDSERDAQCQDILDTMRDLTRALAQRSEQLVQGLSETAAAAQLLCEGFREIADD